MGPGPYTGLRVGLVTAASIADALDIPGYGVCSLDAVSPTAAGSHTHRRGLPVTGPAVLVATDARRREVYWATYSGDGERCHGPGVAMPADLAAQLPELGVRVACGAGARVYAGVLGLPLLEADYPDPVALVARAADRIRARAPGELLRPLYLRRPDATEPGRSAPEPGPAATTPTAQAAAAMPA